MQNKRAFQNQLKATVAAACVATLTSCAHTSASQTSSRPASSPQIITFESDANGFNTKTFFYDNGSEVVAFDAQFTDDLARQAIATLRKVSRNPIKYLVVTHPNPDKFNGMKVFQEEGAKVVMSDLTAKSLQGVHDYKKYYFVNMAKMFTEETYPKLSKPDEIFSGHKTLNLSGGDKIELVELATGGVSSNQTVALIPAADKLVVGDLIHHQAHAWLEGPIVNGKPQPNIKSWIATLETLKKRYDSNGAAKLEVLGGRGDVAPLAEAVDAQVKYLKIADRLVSSYVKQAPKKELQDPVKSQAHYQALTKDFERQFPSYKLPYMIQYGVYGLVNSKIK